MPQHVQERAPHDAEVEPETPVFHVPDVGLHAVLHLVHCFRLAAEALHLCPSRDAGFYQMAHHVTADQARVFLRMEQHVRARPYEAHVAFEHIDELRQLVDVGFTHQVAEFEFARVVLGGLYAVAVFVDVHASELQAIELFSVQSVPLLFKENRPRTLYFDDDTCNEVHNRKYGEQK